MSFITKETYNDAEKQKKVEQLTNDIADCIRQNGKNLGSNLPHIAHLLYQVGQFAYPFGITLEAIANGVVDVKAETREAVTKELSEEVWEELLLLLRKYPSDIFAMATLAPFTDSEAKEAMTTPDSISRLAQRLLDIKAGERVADVCCGSGTFMVAAALEENKASYHGYEINEANGTIAQMRAELLDADIDVSFCDVFTLVANNDIPKYDKIFADYPLGLKLKNLGAGTEYLEKISEHHPGLFKATSSDWVFNALLCDLLKENGRAVGIMTNGGTWNSIDMAMRKHFVEGKMVECVISLPAKMFTSTGIPTTMIVLSHNNDSVRMIDATKHYQQGRRQNEFSDDNIKTIIEALTTDSEYSKSISLEELRDNEYNLILSRYIDKEPSFQNGVVFESVIKSISRGAPCTASQLDEMVSDSVTNMQYLMLANIQGGMIDDKLPYLAYIESKYEKYCLKNNNLIISKNGYPYKVAVASVEDDRKILANGNLYIIELDETKANPYFVKAFFESEQGIAALKSITVGATIPSIGVDKLKKIQIPLPDMDEQNRIAEKYLAARDEVVNIKANLEKAVYKLQHIFDDETL